MSAMRLLRLLLCGLAIACLWPARAQAELKSIWGPNTLPDGHSAFPTYKKLHVDVLQRQLQWNLVATSRPAHPRDPNDPAYRWPDDIDTAAAQSHRYGFQLALMIKGTPAWANGGQTPGYAPSSAHTVADFAVAAARHYRRVRYWMIWGEPARPGNFEPYVSNMGRAIRRYSRILDASYGALKSVRRSIIVIGGMTSDGQGPSPTDYLHMMRLPNGKPPRLDWFGHNPFGVRYPQLSKPTYNANVRDMSDVDTFSREVRQTYKAIHRRPRLWLSEFNVQSDHASGAFSFYVSRKQQASWLSAAYRIAHREPYVAGLGWFELLDAGAPYYLSSGLLTTDGRRKPAWYAYRDAR
jgi:hypothetical protein